MVGRYIRFQMARGPWTGAHGRELWFDTELGDEYVAILHVNSNVFFFYEGIYLIQIAIVELSRCATLILQS